MDNTQYDGQRIAAFGDLFRDISQPMMSCKVDLFQKTLERALAEGFPIDYTPTKSQTLLMRAILNVDESNIEGSEKIINILLDHGADINILDNKGWNALMYASFYCPEVMSDSLYKRILDNINDLNAATGWVSWLSLENELRYPVFQVLGDSYVSPCYDTSPEKIASVLSKIRLLLDAGADPIMQDERKYTKDEQERFQHLKTLISAYQEQKEQLKGLRNTVFYDYEI